GASMSNFQVFRDKVLEKLDSIKSSFKKVSHNWNELIDKISNTNKSFDQKFANFFSKFQFQSPEHIQIMEDIKTKQMIQGEMTFQDINDLTRILWENHDLAQQKFEATNDSKYHEMAMDILLVIKEMEELKEYLEKHGKK
ncbi:MAG: hypothetical protein ACTSYB_18885, partial [Candidatus Helarchaeota archaeon]